MHDPLATGSGAPVNTKEAALDAFIEAGYTLIPLNGKVPAVAKWEKTVRGTFPKANLLPRTQNYGVILGDEDLVIDVDPRNFKPGDAPLARLIGVIGQLDTFVVRTGGGGLHIYLRKPAELYIFQALNDYPGIEFKTAGRQLVGPGSIHPDSRREYTVAKGSPLVRQMAPAKLLELLKRTNTPFAEVAGLQEYKNDAATQGRFIEYLTKVAEPSIEGRGGDNNAYKVAAKGRDIGLAPALAHELMIEYWNPRCAPPWDVEELKAKVIHAYKYARNPLGSSHPEADFKDAPPLPPAPAKAKKPEELTWVTDKQGGVVKCFHNLMNYLRMPEAGLAGVFGFNEFTRDIEFMNPAPWHHGRMPAHLSVGDNDLKLLKGYLVQRFNFEMPVATIEEALVNVGFSNRFHPIREYLEGLKWDGVPRLDNWLHDFMGAADDAYTRACARKTLCAAVLRVLKPGIKFDHVLLLEGGQGIGKSGACKILGGDWFGDFAVDPHNKDTVQLMQGKWIIELAELEANNRVDMDALKAFLTRSSDKARLAYGRLANEFPRQSIFIGSKNPGGDGTYLNDDTGNRRWWPVACEPKGGRVDFAGLKAARNQLWAEAVHYAKLGEKLFMETDELKAQAEETVALRHAEHPWTERIAQWIAENVKPTAPNESRDFFTSRDIFIGALSGFDKQFDVKSQRAIGRVLRSLGWRPHIKRLESGPVRGYAAPWYVDKRRSDKGQNTTSEKGLDGIAELL